MPMSDDVPRSSAVRALTRKVTADWTERVRAYIVVPATTSAQRFSFVVCSKDEQGETDRAQTRFDVPGAEQ
jgi:hypothetical protein